MLHLHFGLNFEALADNLMERLKACWVDPFKPPVIIFPDRTLEHWFKLRWMEKYHALANLNTQFLDTFLFDALNGNNSTRIRLSSAILRNLILSWSMQKTQKNKYQWQTLGTEVEQYLATDASHDMPDETRLFDFANQMTKLFMDYETSRPGSFKTKAGLIQTWNACQPGSAKFFKSTEQTREEWQHRLYHALFHAQDAISKKLNLEYLTLPQLYEQCRTSTDNIQFSGASDLPVFIFWNAGMGQFYRVALHEYSKTHEVYAYIQNPCMEFWEDVQDRKLIFKHRLTNPDAPNDDAYYDQCDEIRPDAPDNALLVTWGRAGRDNIKLWCESVDYDFTFHENYIKFDYAFDHEAFDDAASYANIPEADCTLHKIQRLIAERENTSTPLKTDHSLTITAAPSKIREVEHLHSQICRLLQGTDGHAGARLRDILVVAPDIHAYRTAICQIFGAERTLAEENRQHKHDPEKSPTPALHIPFTIIDGAAIESLTARVLDALFRIMGSRTLSRPDFFELVRNPVVQNVRGIQPDEVGAWETWLTNMRVFRDREIPIRLQDGEKAQLKYDDWKTGIKRLLLSRLTDCRVCDENDTLMPYADLESSNNDALCRCIDAIDALEDLCQKCHERRDGLTEDDLDNWLIPYLNTWISMRHAPRELNAENIIYKNVSEALDMLRSQYSVGLEKISWKCIEQSLRDAAVSSEYTRGSLFVNGLTFMNFTANRILPIKHIFFLGMDATSFPGRDSENSLDLRLSAPWPGDNKNAHKNRYAFLCQLMNTSESLHMSYVHKNLQKDEEFFPSSIIHDLLDFCDAQAPKEDKAQKEKKTNTIDVVPLDETRHIRELFTARAFRNFKIHQCMTTPTGQPSNFCDAPPAVSLNALPERVSLSKLKKYLDDPFQFRVGELLQTDDADVDPEKLIYEPIDIEKIELLDTIKDVAQVILRHVLKNSAKCEQSNIDQIIHSDAVRKAIQEIMQGFMKDLRERGFRTAMLYEKLIESKVHLGAKNIAISLLAKNLKSLEEDNTIDLVMVQNIHDDSGHSLGTKQWQLQGKANWHVWHSNKLDVAHVSLKADDKTYKFLTPFVHALALVLKKGQACDAMDTPITVSLYNCGIDSPTANTRTFEITTNEAKQTLQTIYRYAYIEQFAKAAPIQLLENKTAKNSGNTEDIEAKPQIHSLDELKEVLDDQNGPWRYFKKGRLFDLNTDIGYTSARFEEQWNRVQQKQLELIRKLAPIGLKTPTDATMTPHPNISPAQ